MHVRKLSLLLTLMVSLAAGAGAASGKNWKRKANQQLVDEKTHEIYNSDSKGTIATKSALLVLGNTVVNGAVNLPLTLVGNVLGGAGTLVGLGDSQHRLKDGLRLIGIGLASPLIWLGLTGASLVGIVAPYQGRKYYAKLEKNMAFTLAPCFQPIGKETEKLSEEELAKRDHDQHLLGLDIGDARW